MTGVCSVVPYVYVCSVRTTAARSLGYTDPPILIEIEQVLAVRRSSTPSVSHEGQARSIGFTGLNVYILNNQSGYFLRGQLICSMVYVALPHSSSILMQQ